MVGEHAAMHMGVIYTGDAGDMSQPPFEMTRNVLITIFKSIVRKKVFKVFKNV